jgi:hypothetical protein
MIISENHSEIYVFKHSEQTTKKARNENIANDRSTGGVTIDFVRNVKIVNKLSFTDVSNTFTLRNKVILDSMRKRCPVIYVNVIYKGLSDELLDELNHNMFWVVGEPLIIA